MTEPHPLLPLAHHPYGEQLVHRAGRLRQALDRAGLRPTIAPIVPSPRESGARARVNLRVGPGGVLGSHLPGTHTLVPVDLVALARPEIVAAAAQLEAAMKALMATGAPAPIQGGLELRTDGTRTVMVLDERPRLPKRTGEGDAEGLAPNVSVGPRRLWGDVRLDVLGLRVSPTSFYQVNLEMNERVVADVDAWLTALAPARLLDLYAGIGNLSARAVRRGVAATLIESDPASSADARHNLPTAEIRAADAGRYEAGSCFFDVALLDPPRAGAAGLLPRLAMTRPRAILYLSCEPSTLARDLATLLPLGYTITSLQPYDMFPGTEHVETLAVLTRRSG